MAIDFHVHCFPDELAGRAIGKLSGKAKIPAYLDGTVGALERSMSKAGIDFSIVQNIATKPSQTTAINDWAASICSDKIHSFGTVHPDFAGWKNEIPRIRALGMKGIKFHPDYQGFFADDPRMFPLYDRVFETGLIALFHAGSDRGFAPPYKCTPKRLAHILDAFPEATIVAAHMGANLMWDEGEKYLVGRKIYLDTSISIDHMGAAQFKRFVKNHGHSNILFATDSPWTDQTEEIQTIRSIGLDENILEDILVNNAERILSSF